MESLASKLLTVPDGLLQRNFREIADHVDRFIGSSGGDGIPGNSLFFAADYATLQDAIDAAGSAGGGRVVGESDVVYDPIIMDDDNVIFIGAGRSTIIDGTTVAHGIDVTANYCGIYNCAVQTTPAGGHSFNAINIQFGANYCSISNVLIPASDNRGIQGSGGFLSLRGVVVNACDSFSILINITASKCSIVGCVINANANVDYPLWMGGDYTICTGNSLGNGSTGSIKFRSESLKNVCVANFIAGAILDIGVGNVIAHNS